MISRRLLLLATRVRVGKERRRIMAKRKSTRSQANDSSAATPAQPKARRSPAAAVPMPDTLTSSPDVERSENDDATLNAAASGDDVNMSSSMGSEPSAEDIRMRAYHRFLERGGSRGTDFEDWLEAERDLKVKSQK